MNKERKSKLMLSYIYEDEGIEEDEDNNSKDDSKEEIKIRVSGERFSDPLLENIENNKLNTSNTSNRNSRSKFTGENIEDKQLLYDMGFKFNLINTIYDNMHPVDLQEALDYLNKNDKGKFTHSYIENERFICAICNQGRYAHESTAIFDDILNNNTNTVTTPSGNANNNNNTIELNILSNQNNNDNNNNNLLNSITNNNTRTTRPNRNSSERFNKYENSYLNSINKKSFGSNKECGICAEKIEYADIYKVKLSCGHNFCVDCWENYLQEKINNANVAKISCMQHGCSVVLNKDFIKKILDKDDALIAKYEKFLERQKVLMSNKKVKFCPIPDCDGYAEKKDNKYVKCNFGHDFCFDCLKQPHGKKKCDEIIDADFEEWKKHKIVKRCPNCKIWTEKNEGCNHMTCVECQFQWCWLCQKKYAYGHYNTGSCKGLQFEKEQDEEKIKKMLERNLKLYPPPKPPKCQCLRDAIKEILLFLLFILISPYVFFFRRADNTRGIKDCVFGVYMASVIPAFVAFEVFFIIFTLIIIAPGLIFSRYYKRLYRYFKGPFEY